MIDKEAIERLENLKVKAEISLNKSDTASEWLKKDVEGTITAFSMAIEALERQVPKRTIYKHTNTRHTHWGRIRHDKFMCCNCGLTKEFIDGHTAQYEYCPQCGLKIDWSEENEDTNGEND